MEEITALAAAETIAVLNQTEISLISKIPYAIIDALEEKAREYTQEIKLNTNLSFSEQNISEEAQIILSIIYKDYWCDEEKKVQINQMIEKQNKEYEEELAKQLDPFKDVKQNEIEVNYNIAIENTALIEAPKKWYIRIFDRIMRFFRKK